MPTSTNYQGGITRRDWEMKTKKKGKPTSPERLLERLRFRFGAFEAIAYASLELARTDSELDPPMDESTAWAILQFRDDLRQALKAAEKWARAQESVSKL